MLVYQFQNSIEVRLAEIVDFQLLLNENLEVGFADDAVGVFVEDFEERVLV